MNLSLATESKVEDDDDGRCDGFWLERAEATVFLSCFKDLPDQRQSGKVVCVLNEVLLCR